MNEENINEQPHTEQKTFSQSFWEIVRFALFALAIVLPIRILVAEPFVVSGSSMVPTFENGDYLIIDKLSYRLGSPQRDDVVIFRYPNDPKKFFIKRIIGLPNETVDIKGEKITIINSEHEEGMVLEEPFIETHSQGKTHVTLAQDEYFVMGDNRVASSDSRYWGPLKRHFITGRALLRLLPLNNIDFKPGDYKQKQN